MPQFLDEQLVSEFGRRYIAEIALPASITDNLNRMLAVRAYQKEAFQRMVCYFEKSFPGKEPLAQLLFNMATGSGKTLIMAGAMLYLYERGYRNFLFFTRLDGVVQKTIDNFTNPQSSKYLFAPSITIGGKKVSVRVVDNFAEADADSINIKFQTIGGLHLDLNNPRENRVTFEELENQRIVLLGDEAHNFNAATKKEMADERSWEATIDKILKSNRQNENIFLAFTATIDWPSDAIAHKYRSKTLFRYDLAQYRADGFSKDIHVAGVNFDAMDRALGAVVISQYRRKVAERHGLTLKPVVLMKSKTISESQEFEKAFHEKIRSLKVADIAKFGTRGNEAYAKAFAFFAAEKIVLGDLVREIKDDFGEEKCVSVNSKDESDAKQLLVNSLEEKTNLIRVVFAVDKLNEGWDVLNLFDIVRLYETRQSGGKKLSPVTIAEAQLIGRGARYWPFVLEGDTDKKYVRKFDEEPQAALRCLDELHYHTKYDNRYIAEVRSALVKTGALADPRRVRECPVSVKESIKKMDFWKKGKIFLNEKRFTGRAHIHGLKDVPGLPTEFVYDLQRGGGRDVVAFGSGAMTVRETTMRTISPLDVSIWRAALYRMPFYRFDLLVSFFPHIGSIEECITSGDYLGGVVLKARGEQEDLDNVSRDEMLAAAMLALRGIEAAVTGNTSTYEGTRKFTPHPIAAVVRDKVLKIEVPAYGEQEYGVPMSASRDANVALDLAKKDWYVYSENYGTSEEKQLVHFIHDCMEDLAKRYEDVRLLRNERLFKLYRFADGAAIEPDFVLFLREPAKKHETVYQLFIEPKGEQLRAADAWKEDFLKDIEARGESKTLFENTDYRIVGLPFFNRADNQTFEKVFERYR